MLMLPVTLGLGLINFNVLINSILGALGLRPGAARDRRRVPHLHAAAGHVQRRDRDRAVPGAEPARRPPRPRRPARRSLDRGLRLIFLLLLPAAAATLVLAEPITRLVFQRGEFDADSTPTLVATALFWFSFSLPFSGVNLLLTRTFFSLQRPWLSTYLAVANLIVNVGVSIVFVAVGFGIGGIVVGHRGRRRRDGRRAAVRAARRAARRPRPAQTAARSSSGCSSPRPGSASRPTRLVGLDWLFGRSLLGQVISVGGGLTIGLRRLRRDRRWRMRLPEARAAARARSRGGSARGR